jgi:hypothetical protein
MHTQFLKRGGVGSRRLQPTRVGLKKWGNSPKESMEDNAEMHFLTKKAPISINGDWGLERIPCF